MLRIGQKALASSGRQPFVVDAGKAIGVDMALADLDVMGVVREHHHAARRIHDIVVELPGETLPQLQRVFVERGRFLPEIVGAQDRRVAAGVAASKPALFHHRDIRQPVLLGQVIGGREAMAAGADDDHVVGRLGLRTAPLRRPALILRPGLPSHVEKRKPHLDAALLKSLTDGTIAPSGSRLRAQFRRAQDLFPIWRDGERPGVSAGRRGSSLTASDLRRRERRVLVG